MHAVMRYTVRADQLQIHLDLLRDVYDDLADTRPSGIAWTTYQVTGTLTFVEFVEGPELPEPLPSWSPSTGTASAWTTDAKATASSSSYNRSARSPLCDRD